MSTFRVLCGLILCARAAAAQTSGRCPADNEDVRITALSSIMQYDSEQVLSVMQKLLDRRDECSVPLRRQVVSLLSRSRDTTRTDLLLKVARTDPSREVRSAAIQSLERVNGDKSAALLDSILFRSNDADMQEVAARALAQNSSPNARASLRRAVESTALPLDIRVRALNELGTARRGVDEVAYLRGYFGQTTSPELREAAMRGVANTRAPESAQWLLGIARDKKQEIEVRRTALRYVSQALPSSNGLRSSSSGMELKDFFGLYDEFKGQPELQVQLLDVFGGRPEVDATDKLLAVAKDESNIELRRRAVQRLGQRRDPRVQQFLIELVTK
ncbi:MAG: HEAT repeat domain-containing protein [bacterium]